MKSVFLALVLVGFCSQWAWAQDTLGEIDTIQLASDLVKQERAFGEAGEREKADSIRRLSQQVISSYGYTLRQDTILRNFNLLYTYHPMNYHLQILPDSQDLQFEQILDSSRQEDFQLNHFRQADIKADHSYWIKIRIRNPQKNSERYLFMINFEVESWDQVEIFQEDVHGQWQSCQAGLLHPKEDKCIQDYRVLFYLYPNGREFFHIYLKLEGYSSYRKPHGFFIMQLPSDFLGGAEAIANRNLAVFMGIILCQLFFFLLTWFITRESVYPPYIIYLSSIVLFCLILFLFTPYFLISEPQALFLGFLFSWIGVLGFMPFSLRYLNIQSLLPRWYQISRWFIFIYPIPALILFIIGLIVDTDGQFTNSALGQNSLSLTLRFYFLLVSIGIIFSVLLGIMSLRKGYKPAIYYLIGNAALVVSLGFIPLIPAFDLYIISYTDSVLFLQGGIVLQVILFSLGIGHKRNLLEKEKQDVLKDSLQLQEKINEAASRFVPHEFLRSLGRESILEASLGDQAEKEVAVLFSDIRSYTSLSEQMSPRENFAFLNAYLGRIGPLIVQNKGFVNQYYGDGLMALFLGGGEQALKAAIAIQEQLKEYNALRVQKGRRTIQVGIGIHSGPLMMGLIGDKNRLDAGVVSDTVNTAARMEGLTKYYGAPILLSEYVLTQTLRERYPLRHLGKVQVKGRKSTLGIYECLAGESEPLRQQKTASLLLFAQALQAYFDKDFRTAIRHFESVLLQSPHDIAAKRYLNHAIHYNKSGIGADWDGVERMENK